MNDEYEDALVRRWPEIFRGRHRPLTESLMGFGIEHGDGWYGLLDALCSVLTAHARGIDRRPVEAVQIKEKYGQLRFYIHSGDDYEYGAIALAEDLSTKICEHTGAPGELCVQGGWYATLSPAVAAKKRFQPAGTKKARDSSLPVPELLREQWPKVIDFEPKLPPGWLDIVDALAGRLTSDGKSAKRESARIAMLEESNGRLVVGLAGGVAEDRGAVAVAIAAADRTEMISGCSRLLPPPTES